MVHKSEEKGGIRLGYKKASILNSDIQCFCGWLHRFESSNNFIFSNKHHTQSQCPMKQPHQSFQWKFSPQWVQNWKRGMVKEWQVREGFTIPCGRGRGGTMVFYIISFVSGLAPPVIISASLGMLYKSVRKQETSISRDFTFWCRIARCKCPVEYE